MSLESFIEAKINHYGKMIVTSNEKADDLALGELNFYISLRRVLKGTATTQDKGMVDAINDTLQELGVLDKKKTLGVWYSPFKIPEVGCNAGCECVSW